MPGIPVAGSGQPCFVRLLVKTASRVTMGDHIPDDPQLLCAPIRVVIEQPVPLAGARVEAVCGAAGVRFRSAPTSVRAANHAIRGG